MADVEQANAKNSSERKPEIFINRRSVITLTIATIVLLVLLQPNRTLLLSILDDAKDPYIALAFLNVLREENPSPAFDYLVAKQHSKLNEYEEALKAIEPIARYQQDALRNEGYDIYTRSLWQMATQREGLAARDARDELLHFFRQNVLTFQQEELNRFSQYALQVGGAHEAYLLKARDSTASEQSLFMLAQQAQLFEQAYQHALNLYAEDDSVTALERALRLAQSINYWQEGVQLSIEHADKQCGQECWQVLVSFLIAANESALAAQFSITKAERSSEPEDWLQASQLSLAIGDLNNGTRWLERVVAASDTLRQNHQRQLSELYIWQERYTDALALLRNFVDEDSEPSDIRGTLAVAYAATDIEALVYYLYALAAQGEATVRELREWMVYADRYRGARYVTTQLHALLTGERSRDGLDASVLQRIEIELARFYNFIGEQHNTVALWLERHQDYFSGTQEVYAFEDLNQFIQAFVDQNNAETAMQIAANYLRLRDLTASQLEDIRSLAYFVGDQETLKLLQSIQLERRDSLLDPYLLLTTHERQDNTDRAILWEYYELLRGPEPDMNAITEPARVVLTEILEGAIATESSDEVRQVKREILNDPGSSRPVMQELALRVSYYQQDNETSRLLLQQLILQRPNVLRYQDEGVWLAIAMHDDKWLTQLYQQLQPYVRSSPQRSQILAYAAQTLGLKREARYWYSRWYNLGEATPGDLLSYAMLEQELGNEKLAQQLRWQVLTSMSDTLREQPEGEISYRSLLSAFVGPAHASEQLTKSLSESITPSEINSILFTQSRDGLQRVVYWQALGRLKNEELNGTVQLAIALARKDHATVRTLVSSNQNLTGLERSSALAQIGEHQLAWQVGEPSLNAQTAKSDIAPLQRLLANEHWHRSHGLKFTANSNTSYGVESFELAYYSPFREGQLQFSLESFSGDNIQTIADSYQSETATLTWQSPLTVARASIQSRWGKANIGLEYESQWQASPWLTYFAAIDWNVNAVQSENLQIYGRQSGLQIGTSWQATSRTNLNVSVQAQRYETDFGESLGQSRQFSARLSEIMHRVPTWQIYSQYDLHLNNVETVGLSRLQQEANTINLLFPESFLANKYHRFAVGQRLSHGLIGRPGPDVKGLRYLLDTSVGYNFELEDIDISVSAGLGIRLFGGDELSFTGSWQSADISGETSARLQLNYFKDF